ncbi:MAG TPA: hypothetical protein DIC46_12660, partial [Porphyromonadaceae bacterium]|nr:hypothetical protein [Porphyromonadaceae bacterium]
MKKIIVFSVFLTSLLQLSLLSCDDGKSNGEGSFDPSKPIEVTSFYPDSGGIAMPIIIEGNNFGSDTTGMRVYFEDTLGVKHRAGLVSSNGSKIYAFVPKLTFMRKMNIIVERSLNDGNVLSSQADDHFFYKTQTTVTTVVGRPEPDNTNVRTLGGDFTTATLSTPAFIALDDEDNIFIADRYFRILPDVWLRQGTKNDKGDGVSGNIVMADTKSQSVIVMKYGTSSGANAPTFSGEKGGEAVFVPEDEGLYFYSMYKSLSYAPRRRSLITDEKTKNIIEGNWKYSFVVNDVDDMIYSVMWKGQLVRFNPSLRTVEVLLDRVVPDIPNGRGENGSNCFCIFSPIDPNMLYICQEDYNLISRIDISKLDNVDKATYKGEFYAGKAITEGPTNGMGWEDGLLQNAKFHSPKQICFTADGKLYIADTGNHCIRVIDTTVPVDKATV